MSKAIKIENINIIKLIVSIIGIIIGIIICVIGDDIVSDRDIANGSSSYKVADVDENIKFGADFYTDVYEATAVAANNTRDIAENTSHSISVMADGFEKTIESIGKATKGVGLVVIFLSLALLSNSMNVVKDLGNKININGAPSIPLVPAQSNSVANSYMNTNSTTVSNEYQPVPSIRTNNLTQNSANSLDPNRIAVNGWICPRCGTDNYNYCGTCSCGQQKP